MTITLQTIHKEAAKVTGATKGSKEFKAAVCMLSALQVGAKAQAVAEFTRYPIGLVREFSGNLKASGIWQKDGKTAADWFGKDGGISFNCDVAVAMGYMKRVAEKKPSKASDGREATKEKP